MQAIPLLISERTMNEKLAQSPAPRVTRNLIESHIASVEFFQLGETVTVCNITLDNKYSVRGESACVNPQNYNRDIGEKIAYDNAFNNLWPLYGFLLAEENHRAKNK